MIDVPGPTGRPSRMTVTFQALGGAALAVSFITGLLLFIGESGREEEPLPWMHTCLVLHGILNAVLCGFFGYLLARHIPSGWTMRVNRGTGVLLIVVSVGLIVTGLGRYYGSSREIYYWVHFVLGLILPVGVGFHIWLGQRWARKVERTPK